MTFKSHIKLFYLGLLVMAYMVCCLPFFPVFYLSPQRYRKTNARMVSLASGILLRVLGVTVHRNRTPVRLKPGCFIVSNHLSYIDVLILSTLFPGCFVTSVEIRQTQFLGHITALAGCLFVERRSRRFLGRETREIRSALQNGLNVIVFPEGTSTNGDTVLRFKQPLFQAALDAGKDILPVGICYETINHCPVTPQNRDLVFWYGDMTFFKHFAGLSRIRDIRVRVTVAPALPASHRQSPADLSALAHQAVKKACLGQSPECFSQRGIKHG
jgi:1-acyl-sn-glycerol-3-phosphate acyltransferase